VRHQLVLCPIFALSISLGAVPETDTRKESVTGTNTPYFEGKFKDWPGAISLAQWEGRKAALRRQILASAGLYPLPARRAAPRAIVTGKQDFEGFTVENVYLETKPGYWLGGNLYRPTAGQGKGPAIASPHGHWKGGRLEQTELGNVPARGAMLARMGFVVLQYDMVGYNDTTQTPHAFGNELWSWGPLGLQLWNSIRVVDYLVSRPDVDSARIGATGASGGGTQTFLLAAVDDRIRWAAPVNMISGIMQGGSPCENAPGLRIGTFNVELGALMAPRPLLMVSATGDWTRNTPRQEYPAIRRIYELYGQTGEVETVQIDAPHNYNQASREAVYDFFARKALGLAKGPKESNIPVFDPAKMKNGGLPASALSYDELLRQHQTGKPSKDRLRAAMHLDWPERVEAEERGGRFVLSRPAHGDRVEGRVHPGSGPPVIAIHPDGGDAAEAEPRVKRLIAAGRKVVIVEPFRFPVPEKARYFTTFQHSEAANRAQDLLTVLRWLEAEKPKLLGLGDAGVWTRVAAAIAPVAFQNTGPKPGFVESDEAWQRIFGAPGIRWAGGLRAIR